MNIIRYSKNREIFQGLDLGEFNSMYLSLTTLLIRLRYFGHTEIVFTTSP